MPATAGRVRMPANNRVHSSAALQTHGIWQSAIGYDPYAPNQTTSSSKQSLEQSQPSNSEPDGENAYASFQGLLALARLTGSNADEARGACKKCGRVGHLTFQCRNFLSVKDDKDDDEAVAALQLASKDKTEGLKASDDDEDEDDSESSDSDEDSEMEKLIAARFGKVSSKKRGSREHGSQSVEKKRGRSKKRRVGDDSDDDSEDDRKRRKERSRRRRNGSSNKDGGHHCVRKSRKERKKKRSHRSSNDSDLDGSDECEKSSRGRKGKRSSNGYEKSSRHRNGKH
eukprot:TRINITY_DN91_c1_g1_i3.p1 TRINITY_DN91_c1_g1~~TRINITY_DN91_c1_g1_i3.p1  ORF type:complete len:333 (-),score=47.05 TRINITY_DN91_c1_g1_i3:177-1031(-)